MQQSQMELEIKYREAELEFEGQSTNEEDLLMQYTLKQKQLADQVEGLREQIDEFKKKLDYESKQAQEEEWFQRLEALRTARQGTDGPLAGNDID